MRPLEENSTFEIDTILAHRGKPKKWLIYTRTVIVRTKRNEKYQTLANWSLVDILTCNEQSAIALVL